MSHEAAKSSEILGTPEAASNMHYDDKGSNCYANLVNKRGVAQARMDQRRARRGAGATVSRPTR